MIKKISFFFLFLGCFSTLFAQKDFDFRFWEDSLIRLRDKVIYDRSELERYKANEDFMNVLEMVLNEKNAFKFSWDSVKNFSVLTSPDKLFKIFSWNVLKNDFTCENFGFLHVYNEGRKKYVLYPLFDKRNMMDYPNTNVGNHNLWYGAVYFQLIPLKSKQRTYYTLLGFNANNLFTNQKIIEVLYFKSNGTPVFGANIFKKYPQKVSRVIFEYAKNSTFFLKYENQSYDINTGKRDPKTRKMINKTVFTDMIIFEQLVPMDDGLDGISAYMVPESSLNQGFVEDDGKWTFLPLVKGRNPDQKMPKYVRKIRKFHSQ